MLISQNDSKMKNSKMLLNDRFRSNDLFFFDLRQSLIRNRENVFWNILEFRIFSSCHSLTKSWPNSIHDEFDLNQREESSKWPFLEHIWNSRTCIKRDVNFDKKEMLFTHSRSYRMLRGRSVDHNYEKIIPKRNSRDLPGLK